MEITKQSLEERKSSLEYQQETVLHELNQAQQAVAQAQANLNAVAGALQVVGQLLEFLEQPNTPTPVPPSTGVEREGN